MGQKNSRKIYVLALFKDKYLSAYFYFYEFLKMF